MSAGEVGIVFAGCSAQGLEYHDEQDDTDTGPGEGTAGLVMPGAGDEA